MMVATRTAVEVLQFQPPSAYMTNMAQGLQRASAAAGVEMQLTNAYRGASPWLMLWGPGAPSRQEPIRQHLAAGGHVIAFDGAYWDRGRKLRVSIDAPHPQAWVMRRDWPMNRLALDRVRLGNAWDPAGPVVVAGLGPKALVQYGAETVLAWETRMMRDARAKWQLPVRYRRKRIGTPIPAGAVLTSDQPIDQALDGASCVITWHSNVAVDAIRLGIPVVCRDGAAAAVCPSELPDEPEPLTETLRDRFIANLAWFQWAPDEAAGCWRFLQELLCAS